jgi:hypothetical protein
VRTLILSSRRSLDAWLTRFLVVWRQAASNRCSLEMELCNGDQVELVSGLRADNDFVTCLMKGRGKTFGSWLFVRRSYPPALLSGTSPPTLAVHADGSRAMDWLTDDTRDSGGG